MKYYQYIIISIFLGKSTWCASKTDAPAAHIPLNVVAHDYLKCEDEKNFCEALGNAEAWQEGNWLIKGARIQVFFFPSDKAKNRKISKVQTDGDAKNTFFDHKIKQFRVHAHHIEAQFKEQNAESSKVLSVKAPKNSDMTQQIKTIHAQRAVMMITPTQTVLGDVAFYDVIQEKAWVRGNVRLSQEQGVVEGEFADIDVAHDKIILYARDPQSTSKTSKPVKALLFPDQKKYSLRRVYVEHIPTVTVLKLCAMNF